MAKRIVLNGKGLTLEQAQRIAFGASVAIAPNLRVQIERGRRIVEGILRKNTVRYGINTGLGFFANTRISQTELRKLQISFIRSHAGGTGPYLSISETRLAMALRLNVFLKGHSGVRFELCRMLQRFLDANIYPVVPEYGSVGASGDLIPLAHIALGLMGEGQVHYRRKIVPATTAITAAGLKPIVFHEKEGLSFFNGTEVMQAVGGLALARAMQLANAAHRIAALSFEALHGHVEALDPRIHYVRGQQGQIEVAHIIREELKGSPLFGTKGVNSRLQDPYSLRCVAQVHGPVRDAFGYVKQIVEREFNAVTDNPLIFSEHKVLSGGNFHGEALALAFDFAAIACAELANIAERRLELLCNPSFSFLPAFLASRPGFECGYMVLQYLAASVVNENKVLSHPASTDSIPGNVGIEDFVSMGMTSARKFRQVVENTEVALACELLAAAQAVDLRGHNKLGKGTRKTYQLIRSYVKPLKQDRVISDDVALARRALVSL